MPPKKKKGKKGKGKSKGAKGAGKKQVPPSAAPKVGEETKEFLILQIQDLEKRLARYQKRCDELEVANGQFHDKFEQMATDKKEIVAFWKKQLEQKTDEIADLTDRHIGLQQTRDNERETFKKQIQELRTEYQEMKDQLSAENMILGGKLASLEEFKVQKEDLMAKFAMMEEEVARKEAEHKENIYLMEKKAVMDKDRLKKEMILRVNQVAAEFRKVSNKQMAETTKRTIRENVSISAQLAKMSDKTIELIQENDDLREKERTFKQKIELLDASSKELSKKNNSSLKLIRMITDKCKDQEAVINHFEMKQSDFKELEVEAETLHHQVAIMSEQLQNLTIENTTLELEKKQCEEKHLIESKTKTKIEEVLIEAADSIQKALTSTAPDDEDIDEDTMINNLRKRDHMLESLLVLLNSAAALGVGPKPKELGKQWEDATPVMGNVPGVRKGILKGELPLSPMAKDGALPHYALGDLGLIPRPTLHISTNVDKMKHISNAVKLRALRGVLQKSVSTQTVSAPKALFYADQLSGRTTSPAQTSATKEILRPPYGPSPLPIPKKLVTGVN
uniref:Cilia- and flagella-associated protein 157 n=1 Tax=Arion vulgaris TaxID=1028688 RepID=A0A0B6ZCN1_9EUPU